MAVVPQIEAWSNVWATPFLSVLSLASILAVVIAVRRRYFSSISDLPGPFLASFSHFWQVYQLCKGHTEVEVIKLHREHGDFVRIAYNEVSVAHPDAIKQLLHTNIPKGKWYSIFSLPDYHYVNQMSELDPKRHIHKSRNVASGYALSNIIKSEPYVDKLLELLETRFDELSQAGKPVAFDRWFNYFAFDVVGEVTFSRAFRFLETGTDVGNAIANTRALALYVAIMGYYVWLHNLTLGNPLLSRIGLQPSSHIFDTCLKALDSRKKNPEARNDMVERWMSVRREYPDRMAEAEVMGAAVANIGAGADTTSASLQGLFYYLVRNPKYFERLRQEIDDAQAKGELSDIISYAQTQKLPYLQACIKETYRYHTAIGTGLPRVVPAGGITVAGRFFEPGTVLSINPWVFHRNPTLFGPDCNSFNPDRWLDPDRYSQMDKFLIHWGAGYNQCPGRNLAHFEISKVAAQLTRDYEIGMVDAKREWRFETHFTAVPYGWDCWMRRRRGGE